MYVKVKACLPDRFCIQYDGWTENSKHFLAVIATWPDSTKVGGFARALLFFSTLEDGSDLSAASQKGWKFIVS